MKLMAGWYDRTRIDGVAVGQLLTGSYCVIPGAGRRPLTACPCCGAAMQTEEAARKVADAYYPMSAPTMEPVT